ncbi:MAG: 4Fe-4S dicluster domain-containing protein [Candidatus Bathyarchaeia archaeon]
MKEAFKMLLLIDMERCTDCRLCELACSYRKEGVFNPSRSRVRVISWPEIGRGMPIMCQQCEEAPCISVCPTRAIYKAPVNAFLIDEGACIGCKLCMQVCPFGAISIDPETRKLIKCDLCEGDPACVRLCPQEAILYVKESHAAMKKGLWLREALTTLIKPTGKR